MRPDLAGARQIGVLARHNLLLLLRDPGQIVAYTVMPAVLMSLLQPLYRAAPCTMDPPLPPPRMPPAWS